MRRSFDSVDLFRFSSAVRLAHRIHYDRDFAHADGHRGLVVHGPLQAAWLIEIAAQLASEHGTELANFAYRNVGVAVEGETLAVGVLDHDMGAGHMRLELKNVDSGLLTTSADAFFRVPFGGLVAEAS